MDAVDAIMPRRSVRDFSDEAVTDAELETVLRAAMAAPSASNERPWHFVVVREEAARRRLARATPFSGPIARAPVALVVCADRLALRHKGFWVIDCAAAIENALLAAHSIGLGGVWIGVHPSRILVASVRAAIRMPRHVVPHSLVALGHPSRVPPPVDRFDPARVHSDAW